MMKYEAYFRAVAHALSPISSEDKNPKVFFCKHHQSDVTGSISTEITLFVYKKKRLY